jgi:Holliday junction resolvasome RuvABC endonuclease subunit
VATFVGVDPALRKIGLCVLVDGEPVVRKLIQTHRDDRGPQRLAHIRDALQLALEPYRDLIDGAAVEAQALGALGDIDQLGQVNGVIQVLLADFGVTPISVPPASLKKFVANNPQAEKALMMRMAKATWGVDFVQDDLCDAYGLARFAEECVESKSTKRYQVEAVFSVLRKKKRKPPIKRVLPNTI